MIEIYILLRVTILNAKRDFFAPLLSHRERGRSRKECYNLQTVHICDMKIFHSVICLT